MAHLEELDSLVCLVVALAAARIVAIERHMDMGNDTDSKAGTGVAAVDWSMTRLVFLLDFLEFHSAPMIQPQILSMLLVTIK